MTPRLTLALLLACSTSATVGALAGSFTKGAANFVRRVVGGQKEVRFQSALKTSKGAANQGAQLASFIKQEKPTLSQAKRMLGELESHEAQVQAIEAYVEAQRPGLKDVIGLAKAMKPVYPASYHALIKQAEELEQKAALVGWANRRSGKSERWNPGFNDEVNAWEAQAARLRAVAAPRKAKIDSALDELHDELLKRLTQDANPSTAEHKALAAAARTKSGRAYFARQTHY
jgi:hypothetical protein